MWHHTDRTSLCLVPQCIYHLWRWTNERESGLLDFPCKLCVFRQETVTICGLFQLQARPNSILEVRCAPGMDHVNTMLECNSDDIVLCEISTDGCHTLAHLICLVCLTPSRASVPSLLCDVRETHLLSMCRHAIFMGVNRHRVHRELMRCSEDTNRDFLCSIKASSRRAVTMVKLGPPHGKAFTYTSIRNQNLCEWSAMARRLAPHRLDRVHGSTGCAWGPGEYWREARRVKPGRV